MGVRLLAFTAAAGASDAVLARLDALGAEKRPGRWRTHALYLHPRNEAHGLRCACRVGVRYGCWPLALAHRLSLAHRPQPRPCFACRAATSSWSTSTSSRTPST